MASKSHGAFLCGVMCLCTSLSCLIYDEDLLLEADGGGGAGATGGGGSAGAGGISTAGHLLISEVVVTPTNGEMIEIINPTAQSVSLDGVWLADAPEYHMVTSSLPMLNERDFVVQFPSGMSIAPDERVVIAVGSTLDFSGQYGQMPDVSVEDMPGTKVVGESGLTNNAEMVVLFEWDGVAARVRDLDYIVWGDAAEGLDKTGLSGYEDDTAFGDQRVAAEPAPAAHRCDLTESTETKQDGNGVNGHDETSENLFAAFANGSATPKASPPGGVCP